MLDAAIAGLLTGSAYATLALATVTLYRMIGVLNFALAAIGTAGLYVSLELHASLPYGLAVLVGALVAAGIGAAFGLIDATKFAKLSVVVRSSATIGLLIALIALGLRIFGNDVRNAPDLVSGTVTMGGVRVPYTALVSLAAAVGLAALVTLGLQRTRVGTRMRAMAERPMTAQLVGIPVISYTVGAWAATSFMAAIAVVLLAPTFPVAFTDLSLLIGPAVAAALIGGLVDLRTAVMGGVALGVLQSLMTRYDSIATYQNTLPFIVIVLVLTWAKRDEVWNDAR